MNKTFRLYGIIFIIVLVILALLQINKTEVTDWRKTYDINKKTPFALFVFKEEAAKLFHNKLKKTALAPYEYYKKEKQKKPHNILIIQSELDTESANKILEQVKKGSDLMILSDFTPYGIEDSLEVRNVTLNYDDKNLLRLTDNKFESNYILVDKLPSATGFSRIKKSHEILGTNRSEDEKSDFANFIKIKYGDGNVYLHSEPLIITNYYLLNPKNQEYVEDVFSYLPDRETVWFTGENEVSAESRSPLRFILSKPALKYSWWLFLASLLLFVIFNAKRKQRIVPIIEPLRNKSVEFVKSIGNLYLQEGDFHDMMAKKAQYFLNKVRSDLMLDTQNLDEKFAQKLHQKTGKSMDEINEAIQLIKKAQDPYASVMKEDLSRMNTLLDKILR